MATPGGLGTPIGPEGAMTTGATLAEVVVVALGATSDPEVVKFWDAGDGKFGDTATAGGGCTGGDGTV